MKTLPEIVSLAFSDLMQKVMDAEFDTAFPENGSFQRETRRGREYWYYRGYSKGIEGSPLQYKRYVGPADDPQIAARVERFARIKTGYAERRQLVGRLLHDGLPRPGRVEGEIVAALSQAGLFRLRATLVGSVAYQTYSGLLGVILDDALYRTQDVDVAQYYGIANQIDDRVDDVQDALKSVDPTFEPVFDPESPTLCAGFRNALGFSVEFLTPNRGDRDYGRMLSPMPALGDGIGAQALPFLDLLIRNPVRSLLLHGGGIAVNVPAPERYAVHKLIVSTLRAVTDAPTKAGKDTRQAGSLIDAFHEIRRAEDVGFIWIEASRRGSSWRRRLVRGALRLPDGQLSRLSSAVMKACALEGIDPADVGIAASRDEIVRLHASRFGARPGASAPDATS